MRHRRVDTTYPRVLVPDDVAARARMRVGNFFLNRRSRSVDILCGAATTFPRHDRCTEQNADFIAVAAIVSAERV